MAFLKNVSINAFYKGGYLLLQFLFTVLISKLTGPEGLGIFTLVLVNATVFNVFTSLGLSSGIVYQASINAVSTKVLLNTASGLAITARKGTTELIDITSAKDANTMKNTRIKHCLRLFLFI